MYVKPVKQLAHKNVYTVWPQLCPYKKTNRKYQDPNSYPLGWSHCRKFHLLPNSVQFEILKKKQGFWI